MRSPVFLFTLIAMIYVVPFALSLFRVLRLTFKRPEYRPVNRDEIPPPALKRLSLASPLLEAWGFQYRRALRYSQMIDTPGIEDAYKLEYVHPESGVFAAVTYQLPSLPFHLEFTSCLEGENGKREFWSTLNGLLFAVPAVPEGLRFFDDCLSDPDAVWQAHCRRVKESGMRPLKDEEAVREQMDSLDRETIDAFVRQKVLKPARAADRWRLTLRTALRWVPRLVRGHRKAGKILPFSDDRSWRAQAESEHLRQKKNFSKATKLTPKGKKILLIVSAFLFVLVFACLTDLTFALALFGIIALHEGGHWLVMRLTGHRNTSVFFIPGLGGAALGEKRNATPFERLAVLLAGPMPGLILVVGIWAVMGEIFPAAFMRMPFGLYASLLVGFLINYANLLPVSPLDGGRIVELLLFSRLPRSRFCFAVVCCTLLTAAAFTSYDPILIVLSGLSAGSLPFQWKLLQGRKALKEYTGRVLSESGAEEHVFAALQDRRFDRWNPSQRLQIGEILVSECMGRYPSFRESLAGLTVYLLCLYFTLSAGLAYGDGLHRFTALFRQRTP